MDFMGLPGFSADYTIDLNDNSVTITIKDRAGVALVGSIKVETARAKSLLEALSVGTATLFGAPGDSTGYKTSFNKNDRKLTCDFN